MKYAERKAHEATQGAEVVDVDSEEAVLLEAYRADIHCRKSHDAAEDALDNFYFTEHDGEDPRKQRFAAYVHQRLDAIIKSAEGEEKRRYARIRENLSELESLLGGDADAQDSHEYRKKYIPEGVHKVAIVELTEEGTVSPRRITEIHRDIDKSKRQYEFNLFMAGSYRMFESKESKDSSDVSRDAKESVRKSNLDSDEIARAREAVANMNSRSGERSKSKDRIKVPDDARALDAFEREYFSSPEHITSTEQNLEVLGEVVLAHAKQMAEKMRALQEQKQDKRLRYPGVPHTFWFSGDFITGTPPSEGKDKLLFDFVREKLKQPGLTYQLILKDLPMDKIAKMMGVDLRSEIADYDSVFFTPRKNQDYKPINDILDTY